MAKKKSATSGRKAAVVLEVFGLQNLYSYVGSLPVTQKDSSGLAPDQCAVCSPGPCPCEKKSCEDSCRRSAKDHYKDCILEGKYQKEVCYFAREVEEDDCLKGCARCQ